MKINRYTREVIQPRQVANELNPQAVEQAGMLTGLAAEITAKQVQINDATKLNEASIGYKRDKMNLMDQLSKEFSMDPEQFETEYKKQSEKLYENYTKDMRFNVKREFMTTRSRLDADFEGRVTQWKTQRTAEIGAQRTEESINELATMAYRGADLNSILNDVDASVIAAGTFMDPLKLEELRGNARASVVNAKLNSLIENGRLQEATSILDSKKFDDDLGVDGLSSAYGQIKAEQKRRKAESEQAAFMQSLLDQNTVADPSTKEHRNVINKVYNESGLAAAVAAMDQGASRETLDMIKRTSIIPEAVQTTMRGFMINGNEEQKAFAYSFIGGIEQSNPRALEGPAGFTQKEIQDASAYNALIRSGTNTDFALRVVEQSNSPIDEPVRKLRESEINKKISKIDGGKIRDVLKQGFFAEGFASDMTRDTMLSQYRNVYKEAYLQYGNEDAAEAVATQAIQTYGGSTSVTGKQAIMEMPPEKYYAVDGMQPSEVSKALKSQYKEKIQKIAPDTDVKDTFLVPTLDSKSRIEAGMPPRYYVWKEGDEIDLVRGEDNLPIAVEFSQERVNSYFNKKLEKEGDKALKARKRAVARQKAIGEEFNVPFITDWVDKKLLSIGVEINSDRLEQFE